MENKDSKSRILIITLIVVISCIFIAIFVIQSNIQSKQLIKMPISNKMGTEILGNKQDLVYLSVSQGQKVSGILNVSGSVKGGYFFEANILINILDIDKKTLKQGHANATSDWMTSGPVSFEGSIDFSGLAKGPAYLEIHNDNASGLPENDKSILIPIIID